MAGSFERDRIACLFAALFAWPVGPYQVIRHLNREVRGRKHLFFWHMASDALISRIHRADGVARGRPR